MIPILIAIFTFSVKQEISSPTRTRNRSSLFYVPDIVCELFLFYLRGVLYCNIAIISSKFVFLNDFKHCYNIVLDVSECSPFSLTLLVHGYSTWNEGVSYSQQCQLILVRHAYTTWLFLFR